MTAPIVRHVDGFLVADPAGECESMEWWDADMTTTLRAWNRGQGWSGHLWERVAESSEVPA